MILSHYDPKAAWNEIEILLNGQWEDGRIPHIQFLVESESYRPNASDWKSPHSTSGITQPPILATALKYLYDTCGPGGIFEQALQSTISFHHWLQNTRDPDSSGLLRIIHPWESGTDNSPCFDTLRDELIHSGKFSKTAVPPRRDTELVRPEQRPRDQDYIVYWGLVHFFQELDWDGRKTGSLSPFRYLDLTFNAAWAKANEDLAYLCSEAGLTKQSAYFASLYTKTAEAYRQILWDDKEGFFFGKNIDSKVHHPAKISSAFLSLWAGVPSVSMAEQLVDALLDRRRFQSELGIPSTSFDSSSFEPNCYWRGPVWININYLIVQGLRRYGYFDTARELVEKSRSLVHNSGYREYYHPFSGEGLGAKNFSWSALIHLMDPSPVPHQFEQPILVLEPREINSDERLKKLYNHPGSLSITPENIEVTSTSQIRLIEILRNLPVYEGEKLESKEELDSFLSQIRNSILSDGISSDPYPRICDIAARAGFQALEGITDQIEILWTPNLHYFLRLKIKNGVTYTVDLCADQFAGHPASRIPLLLEYASLNLEEIFKKENHTRRIEAVLRGTREAIEDFLSTRSLYRASRAEQEALEAVASRHRNVLERIHSDSNRAAALSQLKWLDHLLKRLFPIRGEK